MQVTELNNIKIYNLSNEKAIPEWFSSRQRRKLKRKDPDLERTINLIQDFQMSGMAHCIEVSENGQYIGLTGVYKPKFRLYDLSNVSMKVERGMDSQVVKFKFLAEDYSKIVFLQNDRHVEFHDQVGRLHRLRLPKYGRDFDVHEPSAVLYFVGVGSDVYRFDMEMGSFREPMTSKANEMLCCEFNKDHYLFAMGTNEGTVEFWDARAAPRKAGFIDTAESNHLGERRVVSIPSVTSLKYRNSYELGVGTSTGHVLLYDIRSRRPYQVKDHYYGLPIKKILYHRDEDNDLVLSMDNKGLRIWERETGNSFVFIEPGMGVNDMVQYPKSGLIFMACETQKVQQFFIPALGTAPKWCSHIDSITEELEETCNKSVYDGVKFVERWEVEQLGLGGMIGTSLLRAGLHGYFMSERLYDRLKDPLAQEKYRQERIKEKIDATRENRVKLKKLPKVNRELAEKLVTEEQETRGKKAAATLVRPDKDDRFADLFSDPAFQIDKESEEYKRLNPVMSKHEKKRKQLELEEEMEQEEEQEEDWVDSDTEVKSLSSVSDTGDNLSDDELELPPPKKVWKKPAVRPAEAKNKKARTVKIREVAVVGSKTLQQEKKKSLAERLVSEKSKPFAVSYVRGNKEMTYVSKKKHEEVHDAFNAEHSKERRKLKRGATTDMTKTMKTTPRFWMGKRVH